MGYSDTSRQPPSSRGEAECDPSGLSCDRDGLRDHAHAPLATELNSGWRRARSRSGRRQTRARGSPAARSRKRGMSSVLVGRYIPVMTPAYSMVRSDGPFIASVSPTARRSVRSMVGAGAVGTTPDTGNMRPSPCQAPIPSEGPPSRSSVSDPSGHAPSRQGPPPPPGPAFPPPGPRPPSPLGCPPSHRRSRPPPLARSDTT